MLNLKKSVSLFLAAAMTASMMAFPAMADETEAAEGIYWTDEIQEMLEAQGITGDFVTFDEIAVKMYVPDVLQEVELTDEDREAGYIGYFSTEDQEAQVGVMYVNADGMTVEEYAAELEGMDGVTDVEMGVLNGLDAVTYSMPDTDVAAIAFATQAGALLEFSFAPMSDEGFSSVASIMMASIMPDETAETEAEA